MEKDLLGFYFSGHPMDEYRDIWKHFGTLNLGNMDNAKSGIYTVVGLIKSIKPYQSKKGQMCFSSIADYNGEIDLVLFGEIWQKYQTSLELDKAVALRGKLDLTKKRERPSLIVDELLDMDRLRTQINIATQAASYAPASQQEQNTELHIRLDEWAAEQEETLFPLRDMLNENPGPCLVFLHVPTSGGETIIRTTT
jgi:DNA polymerase-3 subunit alpha